MAAATEGVLPVPPVGLGEGAQQMAAEGHTSLQMAYLESMAEVNPQAVNQLNDIPEDEELLEILKQNDVESADNEEDDNDKDDVSLDGIDKVFEEIKERIDRFNRKESVASFDSEESDDKQVMLSEHFTSIPFGIQPRDTYEHGKKNAEIMGLTYNSRMRQFVILDGKGITTWKRDNIDVRIQRTLLYPKYEYRLLTYVIYAKKYNCYFALSKDFSLKVLNKDFDETCAVSAGLRSVLFMLFNPVRDELITGGVGGTKIWKFHQSAASAFYELKPLANYKLSLKEELPNVGGSWVKRVELDQHQQHLYCCSETDLHVYDLTGKLLHKFERAHTMSITGCVYSMDAKVLVTSSVDCEVKVWSFMGGMIHSFRGHSRAVTSLILHPDSSMILITASLDGSIRMWSLDTMDLLYSLVVSSDGVLWMGLTDDNVLFISTCRNISLWSLNQFYSFWALSRNSVTKLSLAQHPGKTTRVVAQGDDSSVRLFGKKKKRYLTTVLPPHIVGALEHVMCVCYSRENNMVFVLINPTTIWVYTTRTDPSCRIDVWNVHDLQLPYLTGDRSADKKQGSTVRSVNKGLPLHRATENGAGVETVADCISLCNLKSSAMMWTDEGNCCPLHHSYLLMGLEDGRILFMDPIVRGEKYMEFKAAKDAILRMEHDADHLALVTLSRTTTSAMFSIWDLPTLTLLHEVYCDEDVLHFTRLDYSFLTGHKSGCAYFHYLVPIDEAGQQKTTDEDENEKDLDSNCRKLDHNCAIVALDSSTALRLFCSASADGVIKIWDEFCVLLTEITMEESLSAVCFLNNKGDILVGFKNHIYVIDHSKVCPYLKVEGSAYLNEDEADRESDILEDPDVLYEGGIHKRDEEVTLENYLVPFKLEFSKDFLEGNIPIEQEKQAEEETSESESDYSMAPTDIYRSPLDSPSRMSDIDLTLGAEVSKYDLLKQMEFTMRLMEKKAREEALRKIKRKRNPRKKKKHVSIYMENEPFPSDKEETDKEDVNVDYPMFGTSPGPTPIATPPTQPSSPVDFAPPPEEVQAPSKGKTQSEEPFKPIDVTEEDSDLLDQSSESDIPPYDNDSDTPALEPGVRPGYQKPVSKSKFVTENTPNAVKKTVKRKKIIIKEKIDESKLETQMQKIDTSDREELGGSEQKPMEGVKQEKVPLAMSTVSFPRPPGEETEGKQAAAEKAQPDKQANKRQFEEEEEVVPRRSKYNLANAIKQVDVKGLMKPQSQRLSAKSRLTSPSPSRRGSEHSHGGVLTTEALKQLQLQNQQAVKKSKQIRDMKQFKQGRKKMTRQELIEQQRQQQEQQNYKLGQLPPHLYPPHATDREGEQNQDQQDGAYPMVQFENPNVDDFQDMMWDGTNGDANGGDRGLSGTKLTLPPSRVPASKARLMKPPPLPQVPGKTNGANKNKDGQQNLGVPMGESPTRELDRGDSRMSGQPIPEADSKYERGRSSALGLDERDHENLTPDIETAVGRQWKKGDLERSTTPATGTIKKLSDQRRNAKPLKVVLPRENEGADTESCVSPVSEITEEQIAMYMKALEDDEQPIEQRKKRRSSRSGGILVLEEKNIVRQTRPYTSFHRQVTPEPDKDENKPRPQTAHVHFQAEDLQTAFDEAFKRYLNHPGTPSTVTKDNLYKNDGTAFEDNWQERVIERHRLLKMQKELRGKVAAQRRQAMEEQRFRSVKHREGGMDIAGMGDNGTWAQTTGQLDRIKSCLPCPQRPPTTPVIPQRPHTAYAALQTTPRLEKTELKSEKPFRFKMGKENSNSASSQRELRERIAKQKSASEISFADPKLIDPRNPRGYRPATSKSIPSKCNRYMLVSRPKERQNLPLPSPVEEQLLAERFPNMGMKVYRHHSDIAMKAKKASYCIEYTPFHTYR